MSRSSWRARGARRVAACAALIATAAAALATAAAGLASAAAGPAAARDAGTASRAELSALLAHGASSAGKQTVQMGETLGISAPGAGEIIRVHGAWNTATHVQADAITVLIGRLGMNLPSEQVVSTVSVTKGANTWIKSTSPGAKWTYEQLPAASSSASALPGGLLALSAGATVKRIALSGSGSKWRISYTASDLQVLDGLQAELTSAPKLDARERALLAGERLRVGDLQLTLDGVGRISDLRLSGELTESRADAAARQQPYPPGGVKGVVLLHLFYTYGGTLAVTAPPAADVSNPGSPLR